MNEINIKKIKKQMKFYLIVKTYIKIIIESFLKPYEGANFIIIVDC